jgi:OOP family OmpA-OmpF porin
MLLAYFGETMNHRAAASLAGLLLASMASLATSTAIGQELMLKPSQVSESALVDALEIEAPEQAAPGKTRGFRPAQRPTSRPTTANQGKASLLITFTVDSVELSPETKAVLDTVAKALESDKLAGLTFKVEGHADPRGDADHNQKLSQARAEAVVNYLVTQRGIVPDRLAPLGKGSTELADPQRPEAPENRRVTLVTNRS